MSRFVDNFWDAEFNSSQGFDVLMKRLHDGRETCKEYEKFLKERAKVEEQYARNLIRLTKNVSSKEEIDGTLRRSFDEVISQTEVMGNSHNSMHQRLMEEAKKVEEFRETQREVRKKEEEQVKRIQIQKKEHYNRMVNTKKSYETKCREADQAEDVANKARQSPNSKELEKLTNKKEKARAIAEAADDQYRAAVDTLENARKEWEKQMATFCVKAQNLEQDRIKYLRNSVWVYTNIGSIQCCTDDKLYEKVREMLEKCSDVEDNDLFIRSKRTGSARPAPIVYECYYRERQRHSNGNRMQNRPVAQVPVPVQRGQMSRNGSVDGSRRTQSLRR
ncbi:proline-serine-threonine phosphatase-interacting protein 1-like isoform X2 [Anneissia japonica]|uniref:proline-serine-threonine phosphatase-interacting protein 1-like isoform X2 n=1 Tax=Anneissia japonica TaxID=1529436 RepID=UPI0014257F3E|nr:proline-serine-threonine phosphatase-interacting protein 1-like isoform X2 [Anneissia japonica]